MNSTISDNQQLTVFQLLSCQIEIYHDDPDLAPVFRYLAGHPQQALLIRKTLTYHIHGSSPYEIREEGDLLSVVASHEDVLHIVYSRVYRRTLERFLLSGWIVLHGATISINTNRLLFLGHKNAGKTTLATRLLYAGHCVEGDEMIMERDHQVIAFPRSFHCKPGIEQHIPELGNIINTLPTKSMGDSYVTALDPSVVGFDWQIRYGPVSQVIWITPNHGSCTKLFKVPPFQTIKYILDSSLGWGESRESLIASATRLGKAGGYELILGNVKSAVSLLESEFAA